MTTSFPLEGAIPLSIPNAGKPCSTYYKIIGSLSSNIPLIVLHGGPGAGHEYLLSLSDLHTNFGIPIIFYDQLGCGRSTQLPEKAGDESFWTVDLFIHELNTLISYFSLQDAGYYLLGQSWGGMLAGDFASTNPPGLRKLILANAPASSPLMEQGMQELIKGLPESVQKDIDECQEMEDFDSERYKRACEAFYVKHLCRLDPWPEDFLVSMRHLEEEPTVYRTMYGPSEFYATGPLKHWDSSNKAHKINVETLLINGRYDEVTDLAVAPWFREIAKVKWHVMENSSHIPHWEERERYMKIVGGFLGAKEV